MVEMAFFVEDIFFGESCDGFFKRAVEDVLVVYFFLDCLVAKWFCVWEDCEDGLVDDA